MNLLLKRLSTDWPAWLADILLCIVAVWPPDRNSIVCFRFGTTITGPRCDKPRTYQTGIINRNSVIPVFLDTDAVFQF